MLSVNSGARDYTLSLDLTLEVNLTPTSSCQLPTFMEPKEGQNGEDSSNYDGALLERQAILLNRIDSLISSPTANNPFEIETIYSLKQEYNMIADRRSALEIERAHLPDPLVALPPELWPKVFNKILEEFVYPIDILLELTLVSETWFTVLTSLTELWTKIRLDHRKRDYLAKAMTGIKLSGVREVELHFGHITSDEWREISFLIIPEGRRIRHLSFEFDQFTLPLTREILGDLTELPIVTDLSLPFADTPLPDANAHEQGIPALIIQKMPSIETVNRMRSRMGGELWDSLTTVDYLQAKEVQNESLEALTRLPNLTYLTLEESVESKTITPGLPNCSLASLTDFTYLGPAICRRLTHIGNNLSSLSTDYPMNGDLNALLVSVSRFPRLSILRITISGPSRDQTVQNTGVYSNPHNVIKSLTLSAHFQLNWDLFFPTFFGASPHLEVLNLQFGCLTDPSWDCIRSIRNLRVVNFHLCNVRTSSTPVPLNMKSLQKMNWSTSQADLGEFLAKVQSQSIQKLQVKSRSYSIRSGADVDGDDVDISRCLTGTAFPNVTSLVISSENSISLELGSLSRLQELEMLAPAYNRHPTHWASNVFEAILIKPENAPALEKISLVGCFVEWDILLLMLERRNFLAQPGISPIKTLVVDNELPYRLLHPISELLGGRFVEREPTYSFSIEAIGERVWGRSFTGCISCLSVFRECESLPRADTTGHSVTYPMPETLNPNYSLPSKYLSAKPPLRPDVKLWLSGKRRRQEAFIGACAELGCNFHREFRCDVTELRDETTTIRGDILVGARFDEFPVEG